MSYRNIAALSMPADFPLLACTRCHAPQIDASTQAELTKLLNREYRATLRERVQVIIKNLSQRISQRKLEALLGMSQGYLSRLRSGAGTPSPELVSLLCLLAQDPEARLQELKQYWDVKQTESSNVLEQ